MQDMVRLLNECLDADTTAMTSLIKHRVMANAKLAAHPTVQGGMIDGYYRTSALGVLNGITQEHGWRLEAVYGDDERGELKRFQLFPGDAKRVGKKPWKA